MRSPKHERFCKWITAARTARGWTQEQAAERCAVSVDALQSWEQGTRYPTRAMRVRLCRGLGLDPLDDHWLAR